MKVELEKTENPTFEDVKVGEVFILSGGFVAMKIERIPETDVNAIYLSDGDWVSLNDRSPIIRIVKNAVLREEE